MKYVWLLLLSSISWLFFYGCANNNFEIGDELFESNIRCILLDTCTASLTTIHIDSVETMAQSRLMVGSMDIPLRGRVQSAGFISFNFPTYSEARVNIKNELILDSITLILEYDKYILGDTLSEFTINIHQLSEELDPTVRDGNTFYNTSKVKYNSEPLRTKTFFPYPNADNRLDIRLPDEMGEEFLNKLSNEADEFKDQLNFTSYFKGLAITAEDESNNAVYGFAVGDSSATINLYYHFVEDFKNSERIIISGITSEIFNAVDFDTESTELADLPNGYKGLPSTESANQSYIMGMTGLYTRIEFPYLQSLLELGEAGTISSAQLLLYPVKDSYNNTKFPLPDTLSLYVADYTNTTVDAITTSYGDALQTGNLVADYDLGINTYYSFTITDFLKDELEAKGSEKQMLVLTLPDSNMSRTFNSVVFGDKDHPSNQQVTLKITYNVYDPQ